MSNSSRWRWAYSIAAVVFPIPPIPVTACTTAGPPDRSAASSSASSSARPVNPRTRAGIVHTRRSTAVLAAWGGRLPPVGAARSARAASRSPTRPGCVTVAVVTPLPASRPRNACWRAPTPDPGTSPPGPRCPRRAGTPTGECPLLGGFVLQLGVGHLRPIPHRRPVAEPGDQHVHVRRRDRVPAHLRRLVVPGGEVRHVRHRVTGTPPRPPPPRRTTAPPESAATPTCATRTPAGRQRHRA